MPHQNSFRTYTLHQNSSSLYRRDQIKLPKKMEFNSQKYVKIIPRTVRFISTGEAFSFPFCLNSIYIYIPLYFGQSFCTKSLLFLSSFRQTYFYFIKSCSKNTNLNQGTSETSFLSTSSQGLTSYKTLQHFLVCSFLSLL